MLGTRGEHAVRLVHTTGHQVVDKNTDVSLVACQSERFSSCDILVGVDAGNEPLPCRFLIPSRAIDLSGEEKILHQLGFQRMG